ncbi:MAG TPA: redoxin domain-containing protein [Terriglobales bacterium]|nr:redoxin domain-containing protein [Terriglobales bacterium]
MLKPTLAALLALTLAAPTRAAQPPDPQALLQKVTDTYRGLNSYHFEGGMSVVASATGQVLQSFTVPFTVAADRSGRSRVDLHEPQMGMTLVSDGKETVTYLPGLKQYMRKPAESTVDSAGHMRPLQGSPIARYFGVFDDVKSARVVGSAPVAVGAASFDCWRVRCDVTPPRALSADTSARAVTTVWVDKTRSLVLEDSTTVTMKHPATGAQVTMDQVTRFDVGEVNGTLPDSLFAFTPPADTKEVPAFSSAAQQEFVSELVGQKAPAFTLKDTKGQTVSLAAYRGRVVVLDFWATWCSPCRFEMPRIEKLHQELKSKGLVVMGVNTGESANVVKNFLAKNPYSFRILLDETGEVGGGKYKAEAIPTLVVVGKDGRIHSYFRGVTDEDRLRDAVSEAMSAPAPAGTGKRTSTAPKSGTSSKAGAAPKVTIIKPTPSAKPKP